MSGKDEFSFGVISLWIGDNCVDRIEWRYQNQLVLLDRYPDVTGIHFWTDIYQITSVVNGFGELGLSLSLV